MKVEEEVERWKKTRKLKNTRRKEGDRGVKWKVDLYYGVCSSNVSHGIRT